MRYPTVQFKAGLSICVAIGLFLTSVVTVPDGPAQAREGNRTLKLYFGHTKERGEFTFKRNGRYDKAELKRINHFLRDWRRNEDANLDPKLLDLVWSIYNEAGGRDYIHVVSAYRSLKTNNMLRSRSKGVAKTSQHTAGKAMDFYIPGVPLAKLRATAMKFQGGGVGYYPTSGSPFVHVDTGSVRSWPRMSRKQLLALFPSGETLYLPADGKPLPGYERAMAKRKSGGETALAYLDSGADETDRTGTNNVAGWLKRVFDGGADEAEDNETSVAAAPPASAAAPAEMAAAPLPAGQATTGDPQMLIAAAEEAALDARLPKARPATGSEAMLASMAPDLPAEPAVAAEDNRALASLAVVPLPRSRPDATLLADTLDPVEGPSSLAVDAEDAIAALAARMDEPLLAMSDAGATPPVDVPLPILRPGTPSPSSAAESAPQIDVAALETSPPAAGADALQAANALAAQAEMPPAPGPRPVALAFAGTGLRGGENAVPPAQESSTTPVAEPTQIAAVAATADPGGAPVAAKGDRIQLAALSVDLPATAPVAEPVVYRVDQDELLELIDAPADTGFSGFAMPQPAGAPGLFTVPESADSVKARAATPKLATLRFQQAEPTRPAEPASEESFFSRLFASLAQ